MFTLEARIEQINFISPELLKYLGKSLKSNYALKT